jgi:hypothetical protein
MMQAARNIRSGLLRAGMVASYGESFNPQVTQNGRPADSRPAFGKSCFTLLRRL